MKKTLLFILLIIPFLGFGQIVTFSFNLSLGSEATFPPDTQPANAVVSSMSRGSTVTGSASAGRFSSSNWPLSSNPGLNVNSYYEFTITPNANVSLSLSSLILTERRSNTGILNWEVRSSIDSYATTIGSVFTVPDVDTDRTGQTISFPVNPNFTARITAVTFRIYGYTAEATGGTWRIDDVVLNGSVTLPITLTSFTGKENNKSIVLNWVTASEKNNKNFEILRSVDGKVFKSIGTVDGAGNSDLELKYSFVDLNPFGGTNYYQLKQIDFNGKNSTSETIAVDSKGSNPQITVYASNSKVNVVIASPNETFGKLTLFHINGKKIMQQTINLNKGYNNIELNEILTPGVHFITFENEGRLYSQKFIK